MSKMKIVSSLKSNATNSPKTPGGISKSLLTPCRRVGLSRNWKNKGPSPFISPLSGKTPEVKEEKIESRKRKERFSNDIVQNTPETCSFHQDETKDDQDPDINKTPCKNVEVPRRKKSKLLLPVIEESQDEIGVLSPVNSSKEINVDTSEGIHTQNDENIAVITTPLRTKSKKGKKQSPKLKPNAKIDKTNQKADVTSISNTVTDQNSGKSPETEYKIKQKSPNDLRKECVVVIQRKIFNKIEESEKICNNIKVSVNKKDKFSSQTLFDSDSDEVPLIELNKSDLIKNKTEDTIETTEKLNEIKSKKDDNEDDDFIDNISTKIHVNKVKTTKSPKNKLKPNKKSKLIPEKVKVQTLPSSQSSYGDDDDDFENKKTILIRKTYEKISKPLKAKSTGSITQKDIDMLKARIEAKKKLLLAQSITPETEELRSLIKKWQKGCQDALMELMDLMKTKFQDKQGMDYSEMLKTLKIPPSLVGYDSENDCFNSPDDVNIILGDFKDI